MSPLLEHLGLKALDRAGWVRRGVADPESVAGHSWGVAFLVMVLLPPELDRERALAYAVIHDLPEVRTGDLTPLDGVPEDRKLRGEDEAMIELCEGLPQGDELLERWRDYAAGADAEARFVRELDRLDMALQAVAYARRGVPGMEEFLASADREIGHPALRAVLDPLLASIRG